MHFAQHQGTEGRDRGTEPNPDSRCAVAICLENLSLGSRVTRIRFQLSLGKSGVPKPKARGKADPSLLEAPKPKPRQG